MRAAVMRVDLHLPAPQSLKEKRAVLRPVIEGLRRLGSISVAEVAHQNSWQRSAIGLAVVAKDGRSLGAHLERARRYLESRPDIEVLGIQVSELEEPS